MQVSIADPLFQTHLFSLILLAAVLVSLRRKSAGSLGTETTQEIKGFAIIAILLAHIGYYLAADHRFLFPLSVLAGVGVDLFLFMSGFGLTASALARELTTWQFYQRRLKKIYIPLWIILACFFLMDLFLLDKTYGWNYIAHSFFGWFPHANLYNDLNSPLWYLSLIIFYYLMFPLVFSKRRAPLSAVVLYAVPYALTWWTPAALRDIIWTYQVHLMAFPLGIVAAWALQGRKTLPTIKPAYLYYPIMIALMSAIAYFAIYSGVGKGHWRAEGISILTCAFVLAAFLVKKFEVRLFYLFGMFSFEVYLVHWPLLYRYDVFFRFLPASLAVAAYFALFICIGWVLQKAVARIDRE
jgi:peptidoglycan/LPS O-acetylase OafA/YrhL